MRAAILNPAGAAALSDLGCGAYVPLLDLLPPPHAIPAVTTITATPADTSKIMPVVPNTASRTPAGFPAGSGSACAIGADRTTPNSIADADNARMKAPAIFVPLWHRMLTLALSRVRLWFMWLFPRPGAKLHQGPCNRVFSHNPLI